MVPTLAVYDDVNEVRNHVFDRHTILKPTHLSGAVIPFYESRKLRWSQKIGQFAKVYSTG